MRRSTLKNSGIIFKIQKMLLSCWKINFGSKNYNKKLSLKISTSPIKKGLNHHLLAWINILLSLNKSFNFAYLNLFVKNFQSPFLPIIIKEETISPNFLQKVSLIYTTQIFSLEFDKSKLNQSFFFIILSSQLFQ